MEGFAAVVVVVVVMDGVVFGTRTRGGAAHFVPRGVKGRKAEKDGVVCIVR